MAIEENKKTLQRYFDELFNNQDYSNADEILHEDYTGEAGGGIKGLEGFRRLNQIWHSAASDLRFETLEMIAEGDKVVIFQKLKATLTGELNGIRGKGQSITRTLVRIYEFKDGKVIRGGMRSVGDMLSFFQQLGALPSTEEIVKAYNESQQQYSHHLKR